MSVALLCGVLLSACDDATVPPPLPPTVGRIRVTSLTTGAGADIDGYSVAVDGGV